MSNQTNPTTFFGNGRGPSPLQNEILKFIRASHNKRPIQDKNGRWLDAFYTNFVVKEFIKRGKPLGSIRSGLNYLIDKGYLKNETVDGCRYKVWYVL